MTKPEFEEVLTTICARLTAEVRVEQPQSAAQFENRVREVAQEVLRVSGIALDFDPHPQAFPDIAIEEYGIEVKFTTNDTWRSVANSVLETNRIEEVRHVYLVFGKMGGTPEVKWGAYERCVMHVRTSHVPRFEVEIGAEHPLFDVMGVAYDEFRELPMEEKMRHIRAYARDRLRPGERMWWLEDSPDEPGHTLPVQARLYTKLSVEEKKQLRAEAALLCPQIVQSSRSRDKYDDAVLYLLTYHGVLCHQARDLFSAGSVANPNNDNEGGIYIERALKLLENEMLDAAQRLEDAVFVEYWGEHIAPQDRITRWLEKADSLAREWVPSESLFLDR